MRVDDVKATQLNKTLSGILGPYCVVCGQPYTLIYTLDGTPHNITLENLILLCEEHYEQAEKTKRQPDTEANLSTQALQQYRQSATKQQAKSKEEHQTYNISKVSNSNIVIGRRDAINIKVNQDSKDISPHPPSPKLVDNKPSQKTTHTFQFDAFISYSHKNGIWVQDTLYPYLADQGLNICLDIHHFNPGAYVITEIEHAVESSCKTITVFSPDYFKSEWAKIEHILSHSLDIAAQAHRIIPILYQACQLPLRFQSMIYIDFTTDHTSQAFEKLVNAIKSRPGQESGS